MGKYSGDISALKLIVEEYGLLGNWSNTPNAHRFDSKDGGILLWYANTKTLQAQGKPDPKKNIDALIEHIGNMQPRAVQITASVKEEQAPPVLFVVYGHDETSRDQLELILAKCEINHFILAKSSGGGQTIIEALEGYIGQNGRASAGIVLLTPDDMGYAVRDGAYSKSKTNI